MSIFELISPETYSNWTSNLDFNSTYTILHLLSNSSSTFLTESIFYANNTYYDSYSIDLKNLSSNFLEDQGYKDISEFSSYDELLEEIYKQFSSNDTTAIPTTSIQTSSLN